MNPEKQKSARPPVSVVLAACNGEPYLGAQMESIVRQLDMDQDELIVSLDPSSDGSAAIIQAFDDPRIRLIAGPGQGVLANFENGLRQAKNPIVFLSDQDDLWHPDKVETVARRFANPAVTAVIHDARIVDACGRQIEPSFFRFHHSRPGFWQNIIRNSFIGCCMAIRKSVLDQALPFEKSLPMHDQWLGLCAMRQGHVVWLGKPLTDYRRHGANVSSLTHASLLQQLRWRLALVGALARSNARARRKDRRGQL